MTISEKLNKVFDGSLDLDKFLDEIPNEFIRVTEESLFGSEKLAKAIDDYLKDPSDSTSRDALKSILHENLKVTELNSYSNSYWIESSSPGNSFADIEILDKLQRSFGTKLQNDIRKLDLCEIRFCIGWKNGRVDSAIWIISGKDFPVRVYSRLRGEVSTFQSIEPTVDGEMILDLCTSYLKRYKSDATADGLKCILENIGLNKASVTEFPCRDVTGEIDFDSIKSVFGIDAAEKLNCRVYKLLDNEACLLWNNLLDKLYVIQNNDGFICDVVPSEFNSFVINLLTALNENNFDSVAESLGNGKEFTFQISPYGETLPSKFNISPKGDELSYKLDKNGRKVEFKLIEMEGKRFALNLKVDESESDMKFSSQLKLTELANCIQSVIDKNFTLSLDKLKYKIAINLLSNCKLEG